MRPFAFVLSVVAFALSLYFLITDFEWSWDSSNLLYQAMLITLICICVLGMVVNYPFKSRKKFRTMMYNSYSAQRIRNKQFDSHYGLS